MARLLGEIIEPWHTNPNRLEPLDPLAPTSTAPKSAAYTLAYHSALYAQLCRRHGPSEHRPSHWFWGKNSLHGERAKILFSPVRHRSSDQAPLVLAAWRRDMEFRHEADRKCRATDRGQ